MSHTDYIDKIPEGFKITAYSNDCPCAAYEDEEKEIVCGTVSPGSKSFCTRSADVEEFLV